MPNTIPPLVCNTPPPIDESENDEDLCEPNDNFDHFNDESLPSSPHLKQTIATATATTILPNENFPVPDNADGNKPVATESPLSLELDIESQHVLEDLENFSVTQDDDEELHFESDKFRNGNDSAIGDVYSNGNSSTITTSKEIDVSNSVADLKHEEIQSPQEKLVSDVNHIEGQKNEFSGGDITLSVDKPDNLSSSPSWNLDSMQQTPDPEFGSLSIQGELNPMENSSQIATDVNEHSDEDHVAASLSDDNTKPVPLYERSPSQTANNSNDSGFRKENSFDEFQDGEFSSHFDADFGQFATFEDTNQVEENFNSIKIESSEPESIEQCDKMNTVASTTFDDEDDDDDFGEFSDFQQTPAEQVGIVATSQSQLQSIVTTDTTVLLDYENIKLSLSSLLTTVFPNEENCDASTDYRQGGGNYYEKRHFINDITAQLRNVENANALAHKWAKSTSKTVLVKALGIDSRNILYGEKWNSSAPKFAANLGLSPLEPMKVTSSSLNESDVKATKSILDVPAAQFDWNSSGLINPLDASHAYLYSALLDLNQLVVVANLDKINLNSSSSACSTTNSAQCYSSTSKSTISSFQNVSALSLNDMKLANNKQRSTYQHELDSLAEPNKFIKNDLTKCINGLNMVNQLRFDLKSPLLTDISNQMNKSYDLYFRAQKPSHEENIPLEQKSLDRGKTSVSQSAANTSDTITSISLTSASVPAMDSTLQATDSCESDLEPAQTSDSYTVPGGTMKETHIFTPCKPIANETTSSLPTLTPNIVNLRPDVTNITENDQISNDCIVIKENVVKKEYRDVEYDPSKVTSSGDDFTEFQFVQPATIQNITIVGSGSSITNSKPQSNSIDILPKLSSNKVEPEMATNEGYLNSFDNTNLNKMPSFNGQMTTEGIVQDKAASTISNGIRSDFEYGSISDNIQLHKNIPAEFVRATDPMDIFSISSSDQKHSLAMHGVTNATLKNAENPLNSIEPYQQQNNANVSTTMNSITPNNFHGSSSILTPQTVNTQSNAVSNFAPSIQWPEPGLNVDQLEQLEKRFSSQPVETKAEIIDQQNNAATNADDEWSDFVSVVQPQTPITNILNKNLLKHQQQSNINDEDDWSEFVSSSPMQRHPQHSIANDTNSNYESMFKSWNTPFQSGSSQGFGNYIVSTNPLRSSTCNSTNHETNAYQTPQQSIVPSIISLPDLGFVAPKSLVNMPNRPKAKK